MESLAKVKKIIKEYIDFESDLNDRYPELKNDKYILGLERAYMLIQKEERKEMERMAEYYEENV